MLSIQYYTQEMVSCIILIISSVILIKKISSKTQIIWICINSAIVLIYLNIYDQISYKIHTIYILNSAYYILDGLFIFIFLIHLVLYNRVLKKNQYSSFIFLCIAIILIFSSLNNFSFNFNKKDFQSFKMFNQKDSKVDLVENILLWGKNKYTFIDTNFSKSEILKSEQKLSIYSYVILIGNIIESYGIPFRYLVFYNKKKDKFIFTFEVYLQAKWVPYDIFKQQLFKQENNYIDTSQLPILSSKDQKWDDINLNEFLLIKNKSLYEVNQTNIRNYY